MITEEQILANGAQVLALGFKEEVVLQGHSLTGALEDSVRIEYDGVQITVSVKDYVKWVNEGFPASSATMKQLPFVIEYVEQRMGKRGKEAVGIAVAIIKTWQREGGMPTKASSRFSSNSKRTELVEDAYEKNIQETDDQIGQGMDQFFNHEFNKEKSETI